MMKIFFILQKQKNLSILMLFMYILIIEVILFPISKEYFDNSFLFISLLSAVVILLFYFFMQYMLKKYSLIYRLTTNPKSLLMLNPAELEVLKYKLEKINLLENTLNAIDISLENFNKTIDFFNASSFEKAKCFSEKIEALSFEELNGSYAIRLPNLGLNLENILLSIEEGKILESKRQYRGDKKTLLIGDKIEQDDLAIIAHEKSNNQIAPTQKELTSLLLSNNPKKELVNILTRCLSFKYLSPYQTQNAIESKENFFGRDEILRKIMSDEYVNYFLVGARALGKSSILKALKRNLIRESMFECHYFSLQGGTVLTELNNTLGLDKGSNLEKIIVTINKKKRKQIFLIDEADLLFKEENHLKVSNFFRKLTLEGKAIFIMAGFWELYQEVALDYQSPLKNFGEVIQLGRLEQKSCQKLMIEPMRRIAISYENDVVIDNLINLCGGRPNLIAMVCNELLKEQTLSIIKEEDIERGLKSDDLHNKLLEWEGLTSNKYMNKINRLIIYMTFKEEFFSLMDIILLFEGKDLEIELEYVENSLKQLLLGYVLEKRNNKYFHRVPLVKNILFNNKEGVEIQARQIIRELRKKV